VERDRARGSVIGWVAASLAVAFAVRTMLVVFFDRPAYVFPDPLPFRRIADGGFWHVGGATIQVRTIFVAVAALLLAGLGSALLRHTRFGRALEAIAQDFDAAVLVGLPVARLVGVAFALAGVWAGLAAILAAPSAAFDVDAAARNAVAGIAEFPLDEVILVRARQVGPDDLRSLDAIHLASAIAVGADSLVTYDARLAAAARSVGISVLAPTGQ